MSRAKNCTASLVKTMSFHDQRVEVKSPRSPCPSRPRFVDCNHFYCDQFVDYSKVRRSVEEALAKVQEIYDYDFHPDTSTWSLRSVVDAECMEGEIRIYQDPWRNGQLLLEGRRIKGENGKANLYSLLQLIQSNITGIPLVEGTHGVNNYSLPAMELSFSEEELVALEATEEELETIVNQDLELCRNKYIDTQRMAVHSLYQVSTSLNRVGSARLTAVAMRKSDDILAALSRLICYSKDDEVRELAIITLRSFLACNHFVEAVISNVEIAMALEQQLNRQLAVLGEEVTYLTANVRREILRVLAILCP